MSESPDEELLALSMAQTLSRSIALESKMPEEAFAAAVMRRIERSRRWRIARKVLPSVVLIPLVPPVHSFAVELSRLLTASLFPMNPGLLTELLVPINSVGAALALLLIILRVFYLKIFR